MTICKHPARPRTSFAQLAGVRETLFVLVLLMGSLSVMSCGGGSGGGSLTASFSPGGTAQAPNLVRLTGGAVSGDDVTVRVVLGGPTTSTDIYGFAFDLVLGNTAVAEYVDGSATVGTVLDDTGCLGLVALAAQEGNRVVVGVDKQGECDGNGLPGATEETVVSLLFHVRRAGTSSIRLEGTLSGDPPEAYDPDLATIGSIDFDSAAATIAGL